MARRTFLSLWVALMGGLSPALGSTPHEFVFHHENVMGTSLELVVRATDASAASRCEARVLKEIDRLSMVFSNHDPASEFRRWQAANPGRTEVSPELRDVLAASNLWNARSGGAFDPRIQILSDLWKNAAKTGKVPTPDAIARVRSELDRPAFEIANDGTVNRLTSDPLTLDAIAKGFIVERASAAGLDRLDGVIGLLLNVGGDLRAAGDFDARIGVDSPLADSENADPVDVIEVRDLAVATSGRSQRFFEVASRRYSHIIDPRSGLPAEGAAGASVIARNSADADALATILNVLKPEDGVKLVESIDGAACAIFAADGKVFRSKLWASFVKVSPPVPQAASPATGDKWNEANEMAIDFEINKPEGNSRRYRRPYVAVWVEDKDGNAVRTITLWLSLGGQGPDRWVPDLKRWYPADKARKKKTKIDLVHTIAKATRQPGKYTSVWDGKDDEGNLVNAGEYTLMIETAREHGPYSIIKTPITVGEKPFTQELKGNAEIKSATVSYRPKTDGKK